MYDLARLSMSGMTKCGAMLREQTSSSIDMEEAAGEIVEHLYEHMIDRQSGEKALALVRLFKTHDHGDLDPELREFALSVLGGESISPETKCLTLLASRGERSEWNSRFASSGHKAIPLPSEDLVHQFPMISNLVSQLGLELGAVLRPDPSCLQDLEEKSFNVFHVPVAQGSAYIPAQDDFVIPCGIRSVLGFGGLLPSGNLFATIMFSKVPISEEVALLFRPLTLSAKIALLPHDGATIFH